MRAIRLTRTLDSETLYLPQLRPLLGQRVEIIVLSQDEAAATSEPATPFVNPLAGSVLRDDDPFGPAVPAEEWEACR